jgi:subtilisin family serine protease
VRATHARVALIAALALLATACTAFGPRRVAPLPHQARAQPGDYVVVTVRNASQAGAVRAGSTPRGYDHADAYGVTAAASDTVRALERAYGMKQVSAWPIATLHVHCIVFRTPRAGARDALIARLARDPRVESAEPLNEFSAQAAPEPSGPAAGASADSAERAAMPYNDPYAPLQRALRELDVIGAQRESRGAGVRIAIIDTGIDLDHPDLRGRIIEHRNFVDEDEQQFRRDRHGTEVAGVIAADANNRIGIVGIAPEAQLLAFKACWQAQDDARRAVCNSFTLAQGLEAAILARADVVNLSLAGPPDPLLARLLRDGEHRGMLFVGAVAPSARGREFPTDLPGVLAVGAAEDEVAGIDRLLAPGHEILTLVPGGHYDFATGSSLATAEVSGILALMISRRPRLGAEAAERILAGSARGVETRSGELSSVNACFALATVLGRGVCDSGPGSLAGARALPATAR